MRVLKTISAAAALFAVAAIIIFIAQPNAGEAASTYQETPANTAESSGTYTMGTSSISTDNAPRPEGCVSNRNYDVEVRQTWIGGHPIEAKEDRNFPIGDEEWPATITVDNLDPGSVYRLFIDATCAGADGVEIEERYDSSGIYIAPGYDHTGDWFTAKGNAEEMKFHIQPATICDEGYLFRYRVRGSDNWTETRRTQGAATPASDLRDGFVVFTVDNADPAYKKARAFCVYDVVGSGENKRLKLASMSSVESIGY